MTTQFWKETSIITWTQLLLDSYEKLLGKQLMNRKGNTQQQAHALFFAPFVVVSHGTQADPVFNYANQTALDLWEMSWEDFTNMPSRFSAEEVNREERQRFLAQVAQQNYLEYSNFVRITSTKKRFMVDKGIVWNIFNPEGKYCGQAAQLSHWHFL